MTVTVRSLSIAGVFLFACGAPMHAQHGGARRGFWAGLGLAYGSARFLCDTCTSRSRLGGYAAAGEFGWTLSPHVQFGAEARQWLNGLKQDRRLPVITSAALLVVYYPRIRGGPFVEGAAGFSYYKLGKGTGDPIEPISKDTTYNSGHGWGSSLGVGWEFPWRGGWFTPRVIYAHGNEGMLKGAGGGTLASGWRQNVLLVEVGVRGGQSDPH